MIENHPFVYFIWVYSFLRQEDKSSSFNPFWEGEDILIPILKFIKLTLELNGFYFCYFFSVPQISTRTCVLVQEAQKLLVRLASIYYFFASLFLCCFSWSNNGHVYTSCNWSSHGWTFNEIARLSLIIVFLWINVFLHVET